MNIDNPDVVFGAELQFLGIFHPNVMLEAEILYSHIDIVHRVVLLGAEILYLNIDQLGVMLGAKILYLKINLI